jgi:peptide/nickel transport system substrate-binding protein
MPTQRTWALAATVLSAALFAAGCSGGADRANTSSEPPSGGTLRLAGLAWPDWTAPNGPQIGLDPGTFDPTFWELGRCCLIRTLLSYNGRPTAEGGSILRPDLAADLPTISRDGRTWTFRLRRGVHYAPPLQNTEIVAQDYIRGIERNLTPAPRKVAQIFGHFLSGTAGFYIESIQGAQAFAEGRADSISGLQAPDEHTLVVHTTGSSGDLGYRLSLPTSAPIPAKPGAPTARLGVATGYDDGYWRFLVASGPYMIEGSKVLDFKLPPARQRIPVGYVPGKKIVLVRNPSWSSSTDPLRKAYADRIVVRLYKNWDARTVRAVARLIDRGKVDFVFGAFRGGADASPPDQVRQYQATPALRAHLDVSPVDAVRYVSMNLAVPPFDDVHVRRAVNLAIDKKRVLLACCSPLDEITGHVALDSVENNLLLDYDPYRTTEDHGNIAAAKAELARSRYDRNHDGVCDVSACRHVFAPVRDDTARNAGPVIRSNLARIGIHLEVHEYETPDFYRRVLDAKSHTPIGIGTNWTKDYPSGSNFFSVFYGPLIGTGTPTLIGASPSQLAAWGYEVRSVPSVDAKIRECLPLVGSEAVECWAQTDQLLMEKVVPVVPLYAKTAARVFSGNVARFVIDQFVALPALDQIALKRR